MIACDSAYQLRLEESQANGLFGGCTKWCTYDFQSVIANEWGGYIWKKPPQECWLYVSKYVCFEGDALNDFNNQVIKMKTICPGTISPTASPSVHPTFPPSAAPASSPTSMPSTLSPTFSPTNLPTVTSDCYDSKGVERNVHECNCGGTHCTSNSYCDARYGECSTYPSCPDQSGHDVISQECACGSSICNVDQICTGNQNACIKIEACIDNKGQSAVSGPDCLCIDGEKNDTCTAGQWCSTSRLSLCSNTPPTETPTWFPTRIPTLSPTSVPTQNPTVAPTEQPTLFPTLTPTTKPTLHPSEDPTAEPKGYPTVAPTAEPTGYPTVAPTAEPTFQPTPTQSPTTAPSGKPSDIPTQIPSLTPTNSLTSHPIYAPSESPTWSATHSPSENATMSPTQPPTHEPADMNVYELNWVLGICCIDESQIEETIPPVAESLSLDVSSVRIAFYAEFDSSRRRHSEVTTKKLRRLSSVTDGAWDIEYLIQVAGMNNALNREAQLDNASFVDHIGDSISTSMNIALDFISTRKVFVKASVPLTSSPSEIQLTSSPSEIPLTSSPSEVPLTSSPSEVPFTSSPSEIPESRSGSQQSTFSTTAQPIIIFVIVGIGFLVISICALKFDYKAIKIDRLKPLHSRLLPSSI